MKLHRFCIIFLFALLFSCKQKPSEPSFNEESATSKKETLDEASTADEASPSEEAAASDAKSTSKMASSSSAVVDKNSNRKFIRTAELKFKVTDVAKSTYAIENTVTKMGGFVASTELKSTITHTSSAEISSDSIVETTRFIVENMIISVPNTLLDSTLKVIAKQIDFLDYRIIKADDVSLQLLSNQLSQKRNQLNQNRVEDAIKNRGKKLGETLDAEDRLYDSQIQSDETKLSTLSMKDQINFSTIALAFYQKESITNDRLANPDNEEYRTSFGVQVIDGLKRGWYILEAIIVFLVNIWTLLLVAAILWFVWKKFKKTKS